MYTIPAYVPPTYRRVKKLRGIMCNKNLCMSLASTNESDILIWTWNNPSRMQHFLVIHNFHGEYDVASFFMEYGTIVLVFILQFILHRYR